MCGSCAVKIEGSSAFSARRASQCYEEQTGEGLKSEPASKTMKVIGGGGRGQGRREGGEERECVSESESKREQPTASEKQRVRNWIERPFR
eukprot:3705999-Pleurochrysis_carterae.AAC.1